MVPMNSKANLSFILEQSRKQNASIVRINAQNNGITTLEAFQILFQFPKLVSIDLRNNKISSLEGVCKTAGVKELLLDGNPICEKHSEPHAYVAEVKQYFTQLEYLDGHKLDKAHNLVTLQNFIVTRDAYVFADEFVKTYFNVYDSEDRRRIMQAYDQNSIFTISCYFDSSCYHATAPSDLLMRVQRYAKNSRSINKMSNMNLVIASTFHGLTRIDKVLNELPKTQHIFTTFSIDVPVYEPSSMVVITVSGTFEDYGIQLNETTLLVAFTRTFVLRPSANNPNEFHIYNSQLSIHCPTPAQREESTLGRKASVKESFIEKHCRDLMPTEIEEKEMKLILFKELTEQKTEICIQHLESSFWNVKVALAIFNTLMDSNELSNDNFEFK
jgi:Nuclear transport factor 2 (NTF2) domain